MDDKGVIKPALTAPRARRPWRTALVMAALVDATLLLSLSLSYSERFTDGLLYGCTIGVPALGVLGGVTFFTVRAFLAMAHARWWPRLLVTAGIIAALLLVSWSWAEARPIWRLGRLLEIKPPPSVRDTRCWVGNSFNEGSCYYFEFRLAPADFVGFAANAGLIRDDAATNSLRQFVNGRLSESDAMLYRAPDEKFRESLNRGGGPYTPPPDPEVYGGNKRLAVVSGTHDVVWVFVDRFSRPK